MNFRFLSILLISLAVFNTSSITAQILRAGVSLGLHAPSISMKDEVINDQITVSGNGFGSGVSAGFQVMLSPPKLTSKSKLTVIPSVMAEVNACRCTFKSTLSVFNDGFPNTFNQLNYVNYNVSASVKYVAHLREFNVMIGPTVTYNQYTGMQVVGKGGLKYANDQFKTIIPGYEIGGGKRFDRTFLTLRYQGYFGRVGQASSLIPDAYSGRQIKLVMNWFFIKIEREAYWKSIMWKK